MFLFTYHIVNIKGLPSFGIVVVKLRFTYHIVNIKDMKEQKSI